MTSRVNDMPPPWPNQALAQAREASQVSAQKTADKPTRQVEDQVAVQTAAPPAEEKSANVEAPSESGAGNSSVSTTESGHVNIVA